MIACRVNGCIVEVMTTDTTTSNTVSTASRLADPADDMMQATVLFSEFTSTDSDVDLEPPVSEAAGKVHDRAVALTTVLTHIMERPAIMRDWGINE